VEGRIGVANGGLQCVSENERRLWTGLQIAGGSRRDPARRGTHAPHRSEHDSDAEHPWVASVDGIAVRTKRGAEVGRM